MATDATDVAVRGPYVFVDGTPGVDDVLEAATRNLLMCGCKHYRRVNVSTGKVYEPEDAEFSAILPMQTSNDKCMWGWFVGPGAVAFSPTYIATTTTGGLGLKSKWAIPCTGWVRPAARVGIVHNVVKGVLLPPKSEPVANQLVRCSDAMAANILQGLGCYTPKEIAKQRKVNAAAGRGDFADAELELSAQISAAQTPLLLRTMGGDALKLDWSGPWKMTAAVPFAIDVRALAIAQYPDLLGGAPDTFDLIPYVADGGGVGGGGIGGGGGGGGGSGGGGVGGGGGGGGGGAAAAAAAPPPPLPPPAEAPVVEKTWRYLEKDHFERYEAERGDLATRAFVARAAARAKNAVSTSAFPTAAVAASAAASTFTSPDEKDHLTIIDFDRAHKMLSRNAGGSSHEYLVFMRPPGSASHKTTSGEEEKGRKVM